MGVGVEKFEKVVGTHLSSLTWKEYECGSFNLFAMAEYIACLRARCMSL